MGVLCCRGAHCASVDTVADLRTANGRPYNHPAPVGHPSKGREFLVHPSFHSPPWRGDGAADGVVSHPPSRTKGDGRWPRPNTQLPNHTISTPISAGDTPDTRDAWPRFAGRTAFSFSRASNRNPFSVE